MPSNPHKAAVRADSIWSTHDEDLDSEYLGEIVTREYRPLVEAAQDLCKQWGKGDVAFKVAALRAALERCV